MKHRLTRRATADIARILKSTRKDFGAGQMLSYAGIIDDGIAMILQDPNRPACRPQNGVGPGIKSMHLDHVRARRGSASHLVFFKEKVTKNGEAEIVILGVIHDRMMPRRKLATALREERDRDPT
ncbi:MULTISPECIES: type II toxin-antitoxin system RelE/ParE family toxin [unclassified Devosia]|uniref:type II toxin-antitoxin system RelE/ParE family toxin n=1 Tax=unclassified Devosia TaxID=196773 RepID=UPI0007867982|nr:MULTISPECIES: type II toxin-antitoxin system RelE/ParE family toxin [unclassified Devosia]